MSWEEHQSRAAEDLANHEQWEAEELGFSASSPPPATRKTVTIHVGHGLAILLVAVAVGLESWWPILGTVIHTGYWVVTGKALVLVKR